MKEKAIIAFLFFLIAFAQAEDNDPAREYLLDGEVNSISVDGDLVCVGSEDNNLYLFDRYLGLRWRHESEDEVMSVAVSVGLGFVGVFGGWLGVVMVMVVVSVLVAPSLSVTCSLMVCVPSVFQV